jgi:hypothetical protein
MGYRKRGSEHGSDGDGDSEVGSEKDEGYTGSNSKGQTTGTLLDGDFLEFTVGRPMPMNDRAKAVFHMSILNVSFWSPSHIICIRHVVLTSPYHSRKRTHSSSPSSMF